MKGLSMWLDLVTWTWTVVLADACCQGDGFGLRRSSVCVFELRPHHRANPRGHFLGG